MYLLRCYRGLTLPLGIILALALLGCSGSDESKGKAQTPTSSVEPAQAVSSAQSRLLGDLDGDGEASVGDAIKILRIVVGLDPEDECADANENGNTDVGDAIKVLRCVVGLDDWPIGQGGSSYELADLAGDWRIQMLVSGDAPQYTGWARGGLSIDAAGNAQWTYIERSNGDAQLPGAATVALSADGTLTWPAQPARNWHGTLSPDRNCFVWTMTDGGNGYLLGIAYRQSTGFSGADFVGRWLMHCLITGDAPQYIGWAYGAMTVNAGGNAAWEYHIRSNGENWLPPPVRAALAADGTIALPDLGPQYRAGGSMAPDKELYTLSFIDGGGGWLMAIEQRAAQGCSTAQVAGRWSMHAIVAGDAPQYTGWAHGIINIDAAGNARFESMFRSNGDNSLDSDSTITVQPDGTFTGNPPGAQMHGAFSPANGFASMTMNDGGGGYLLGVMQKLE